MSGAPGLTSARLYLRAQRFWTRALAGVDATLSGIALGLLSRRALQALDEEAYRRLTDYASDEHNLRGLFDWEEKAYGEFFYGRRRIVILAAGAGREAIGLAARGHEVVAYECHPDLLRAGAALLPRAAPGVSLQFLERDRAPTGIQADAAIVGWSAYTLMIGRATRIALLRELAQVIPPGGPILLSFFPRPEGRRRERWVARIAGSIRWLRRGPPVEEGDDLKPKWLHKFTQAEVEGEIAAAGLIAACFSPAGEGRHASAWAVALRPPAADAP